MPTIVPPIKSQGIKTKLVPWILTLAPKAKGRWIEPFCGTCVVALNAQYEAAIINDINPHIIAFYASLQDRTITPEVVREYLVEEGKLLSQAEENGYEHFRKVKNRFNEQKNPLDFLFLSRAGFNGMIRFNRKGHWNIPFCKKPERFSKAYVTKIVNQVRQAAQIITPKWEFRNQDFEEVIGAAQKGDLIYCDPPYMGRHVDYFNGWTEGDEERLFSCLEKTKAHFILSTWHHNSFRSNEMIPRFWNKFNIVTKDHMYHAGAKEKNRNPIVEALVFNFEAEMQKHTAKAE